MNLKKPATCLMAIIMAFSIFSSASLVSFATSPTIIVPTQPTGSYDSPKKIMEPGRVHWMNFADMSPWWGTALRYDEHVWSDYADTGGLWSFGQIAYTPLDVNLTQISGATGSYVGFSNSSNPTYYRDHLWYGTFQGVRIDYAVFPGAEPLVDPLGRGVRYQTFPGAYIATALLTSSYWVNQDPNTYGNLNEQFIIQYSSDGTNWTSFTSQEINYYWEHGTITGGADGYSTCIAATKLPDNCSYYKVLLPSVATKANQQAGIGPTKVSSVSMSNGAIGDAFTSAEYLPTSTDTKMVIIDLVGSKVKVRTIGEISLSTVSKYISQDTTKGSYEFFNLSGNKITDLDNTILSDGMTLRVFDSAHNLKSTFALMQTNPDTVTISPTAFKKALNPGVVDWATVDPIPGGGEYQNYSDYAFLPSDQIVAYQATQHIITNKMYGTFFGEVAIGTYRSWSSGEGKGVIYRVVPNSYVSTALLIHASLVTEGNVIAPLSTITEVARKFTIKTSSDGVNWTAYDLQASDISLGYGEPGWGLGAGINKVAGYVSVRSTIKIPEDNRYYMVEFPTAYGPDFCFVGGSKASLTDMHGASTGDAVQAWYPLPEVVSNDLTNCIIDHKEGTMLVKSENPITIQETISKLNITGAVVKFYNSNSNEITDFSTKLQSGMVMKAYATQANEPFLVTNITTDIVTPPEEASISLGDATKIQLDIENKTITLLKDITLQELKDALILKGGIVIAFTDSAGLEINDLSQLAKPGMSMQTYTSFLLGDYSILKNQPSSLTPENSNNTHNNPNTGDNLFQIVFLIFISLILVKIFAKKRIID